MLEAGGIEARRGVGEVVARRDPVGDPEVEPKEACLLEDREVGIVPAGLIHRSQREVP